MYNMKQHLNTHYKISLDPAAESRTDPHMYVIRGRHAEVYYHGPGASAPEHVLGVDFDEATPLKQNTIRSLLTGLGGIIHTHTTVLVTPDTVLQPRVARILGLPRRRKLNPEHKAKFTEAGKRHRFACQKHGSEG